MNTRAVATADVRNAVSFGVMNKELFQREFDKIAAAKAAEVAKEEARVKWAAAAQKRKADHDAASQVK